MPDLADRYTHLIDHLANGLDLPRDEIIRLIHRAMSEPLEQPLDKGWPR